MMYLAFLSPSPPELAVIAVIALIVLGPTRLPEAARSLGRGMREMRDSFQNATRDDEDDGRLELPDEDQAEDVEAPADAAESKGPAAESSGPAGAQAEPASSRR